MENISVIAYLRKDRIDASGKAPLYLKVYVGEKLMHSESLSHKVDIKYWDDKSHKVKFSHPNSKLINLKISNKINELENSFLQNEVMGFKNTKARIKRLAKGEDYSRDFIQYCRERIAIRYPRPDQGETRRTYQSELTKISEFQSNISLGDIDYDFLARYKQWMISKRSNSENTIWKTFKFLNTFINDAIKNSIIKSNPFDEFNRGTYVQKNRRYLELSDCDKIHNLLLDRELPERLKLVGFYYLFMCYTGFRFQDATVFFNYDNHVINDERIIIETQKSNSTVNLLIHSRLRSVLDVIKNHPLKISNKEFNSYTKVLATMAGIELEITAHTGRHTFGATLAELNIPIERAQKLLGHKDKKSTEIYYHIKNKNLDDEMMKWDLH